MCTGAGEQLSWPIVVAEKAQGGNHMEGRKAHADRLTVVTGPPHARARNAPPSSGPLLLKTAVLGLPGATEKRAYFSLSVHRGGNLILNIQCLIAVLHIKRQ